MKLIEKREAGGKDISAGITNVLLFLGVVMVLLSILFLPDHVKEQSNDNQFLSETDYQLVNESDGSRTFIFDGKQIVHAGGTLAFSTNHQMIEAKANGEQIFSVQSQKTSFGKTTGCRWNFISVPDDCEVLTVTVKAVYATNAEDAFTFVAGNGNGILRELLRDNVFSGIISIINVTLGISMIVFWFLINAKTTIGRSLLYLGQFAVVIGLWSFGETTFSVLILSNRAAMTYLTFLLLQLMPLPFILFAREFMRVKKDVFWYVLFYGILVNILISTGLQLLRIKDLKETVFFTHITLVLAFVYLCYCLMINIRKRRLMERVRSYVLGITILGISVVADLAAYYMGSNQVDFVGRIGFIIYILLLGAESARETLGRLEEGLKAEYYHKMAITDDLTGLYNRTAFDNELVISGKHAAAVFDVNDLKYVNDTYGHIAGDQYIIQASALIQKAFSEYGSLYRIGGDEFCCISEKMSQADFELAEARLKELEEKNNASADQIAIHIACGFACSESDDDKRDINELIALADTRMYQNKRAMKAGQ